MSKMTTREEFIVEVVKRLEATQKNAHNIDDLVEATMWVVFDSRKRYILAPYYEGLSNTGVARLINSIESYYDATVK